MATDQAFTFDQASQRFRSLETGRFVSERSVRDGVDRMADLASQRMGDAAARFRSGELSIGQFQTTMLETIRDSQISAALAAYGGRQNMDASRWGLVGQQIRVQNLYARQMIADVLNGKQPMNGRLDARARMYGQSARTLYENIRRRESARAGLTFEQNHLHAKESCEQCIAMTRQGRVPIGTLIPVGQRTCRASCRCTLSYSRTMSEVAA